MRSTTSLVGVAATLAALTLGAATALATSGVFQGYSYTTFGAATATQFGTDSLRIANIGSSGNDGVSVTIPTSMRGDFVVKRRMPAPAALPLGAYVISTVTGTVNSIAGQTVWVRREVNTSTPTYPVLVRDDFSAIAGDKNHYLAVRNSNYVMDHVTAAGDTAACVCNVSVFGGEQTEFYVDGDDMGPDSREFGDFLLWMWGNCVANATVVKPQSSTTLAAVSNLSAVSMRAKDIPSFTITALSVEARPYTVPSASIPAIAFGGVALLVAGIVALRRGSMLA